jgi:FkbM family methyltransferase
MIDTTTASLWRKVRERGVMGITGAIYKRAIRPFDDPNSYLKHVNGVIHVGANSGQERELYARHILYVLWIEPLPAVFAKLCENIRSFPNQIAVNYLITDKDQAEYLFRVADNEGASSSILEFARHTEIWPNVREVAQIKLQSITLYSLLNKIEGAGRLYQALIVDTQGSELLVLQGAARNLHQFRFIKIEAADFESYVGCARVEEITSYLAPFGFRLIRKDEFAECPSGGCYFDLLYRKP